MRIAINWRQLARDVALLAAIGLLFALLNPFGSVTDVPLSTAAPYWIVLILWGGLAGEGLAWLLRRYAPKLRLWAFLLCLSLMMALVVYPAVALAQAVVMHNPIPAADTLRFFFYVWLITILVSAGVVLGFRAFGQRSGMFDPPAAEPPPSPPAAPGGSSSFLNRLPIRLRSSTLYAVESEDHYLRVHTSGGEELILMRIADAVRELSGVEGLQTHRSWWVARAGLADATRENGKLTLKLKSGAEAPVSRTYLAAVKAAGWI